MTTLKRRTPIAVIAAVALLAPLAACATSPADPATPPDDGLAELHEQQLAWEPCDDYAETSTQAASFERAPTAECAMLAVPLDYEEPDGEQAAIAVMRIPARGESLGHLVTNPGGPGGTGLAAIAESSAMLAESAITERFDLVGFDPRGVGASTPAVSCMTDAEADAGTVRTSSIDGIAAWTEETTRDLLERCAESVGGEEALAHMGTRDAARDMDVLRAALGDEQLTYLGQSYGTRLGAVYAEQFPERVGAMVLDGVGDPTAGTMERRVQAYAGFQSAFDAMATACADAADCVLGTDPEAALDRFHEIVRPLVDQPVPALAVELTFEGAISGVIGALYAEESWPAITAGLSQVEQGSGDILLAISRAFVGRTDTGEWPNFTSANLAIDCMDEQRMTPDEAQELREDIHAAAPFMDPGVPVPGARDACEHWPAEPTLDIPYAQDVAGLPDTLVVSITGDPTTPYDGGIVMAEQLGSALLTVEGNGHTTIMGGATPCAEEIAAAYLIDGTLPDEGATCQYGQ